MDAWPLEKSYSSPLAFESAICHCLPFGPREMHIPESSGGVSTLASPQKIITSEQQMCFQSCLLHNPQICQADAAHPTLTPAEGQHTLPGFMECHEQE
jgi:hypothetical protein